MKILFSFIFIFVSASLFGAGSSSDNNKSDASSNYLKAEKLIKKKNYEKAIDLLSELLLSLLLPAPNSDALIQRKIKLNKIFIVQLYT